MERKKITQANPYQNPIEVTSYESGSVFIVVGKPSGGTTQLGKKGAHELITFLTERFGAPKPTTFHEEFAKLAVGDKFTILDGPNDSRPWPSIKLSDTEYFESSYNQRRHVKWAYEHWIIRV